MKKITFTLLAVLFSVTCFAQDITSAVTAAANTASRARAAQQTAARQADPLRALTARQNPASWQEISWSEFLRQNQHVKEVELCSMNIDVETNRQCQQLAGPDFKLPSRHGQGPFDYASLLTNQKIIYIGENHNTTNISPEVATVLKAVRSNHPNARILLASEFLEWAPDFPLTEVASIKQVYQENLPLFLDIYAHPDRYDLAALSDFLGSMQETHTWLQQADTFINKPMLLKRAGAELPESLMIPDEYRAVFQTADTLGIDQLALDDLIYLEDPQVVKVGGTVVRVQQGERISNRIKKDSLYLLSISPWGVQERNREWARRIQAVLPAYDIIIVYAGSGHLNETYSLDLPPLVGINNYTAIIFSSDNLKSEKDSRWYKQRGRLAERAGLSQDGKIAPANQKALDFPMFPSDILQDWTDHTQPFWVLSTKKESEETYRAIRAFSGDKATEDYIQRYNTTFPVREDIFLFITLPDK